MKLHQFVQNTVNAVLFFTFDIYKLQYIHRIVQAGSQGLENTVEPVFYCGKLTRHIGFNTSVWLSNDKADFTLNLKIDRT